MALPKKRKFLRFSVSKLNAVRSVYKRRTTSFSKGQTFKVSNGFFSKIEPAVTSSLFSHTVPTLELIRAHAISFLIFSRFSLLSTFLYRSDLLSMLKHRLFVFGESNLYLVLSLYSWRREFFSKLPKEARSGLSFSLDGVSGLLRFIPTTADLSQLSSISPKTQFLDKTMLAAEYPFFKKKDSLDDKAFRQKIARLKQVSGVGLLSQPQKSKVKVQTKTAAVFKFVKQKLGALVKTNYGAVSWVTWFLNLFKGMSAASNIRAELGTSVELFNSFFINTKFYKKIQWKTNFKYYYWTNDPLWMRYRYRIYWYKKAIYLRLNSLVFTYYYSRLRSLQKRAKETLSTWHNLRSRHYRAIQSKFSANAETYSNKYASTLLFSKILRFLSKKSMDALSYLCASPVEAYRRTFVSIKLSLSLRKVIFFGIDTHLYTGKTYSGFLYYVDPAVKALTQTSDVKPYSVKKPSLFVKLLLKLTKRRKKQTRVCANLVGRWKKRLRMKPRVSLILLRRRK